MRTEQSDAGRAWGRPVVRAAGRDGRDGTGRDGARSGAGRCPVGAGPGGRRKRAGPGRAQPVRVPAGVPRSSGRAPPGGRDGSAPRPPPVPRAPSRSRGARQSGSERLRAVLSFRARCPPRPVPELLGEPRARWGRKGLRGHRTRLPTVPVRAAADDEGAPGSAAGIGAGSRADGRCQPDGRRGLRCGSRCPGTAGPARTLCVRPLWEGRCGSVPAVSPSAVQPAAGQ